MEFYFQRLLALQCPIFVLPDYKTPQKQSTLSSSLRVIVVSQVHCYVVVIFIATIQQLHPKVAHIILTIG